MKSCNEIHCTRWISAREILHWEISKYLGGGGGFGEIDESPDWGMHSSIADCTGNTIY